MTKRIKKIQETAVEILTVVWLPECIGFEVIRFLMKIPEVSENPDPNSPSFRCNVDGFQSGTIVKLQYHEPGWPAEKTVPYQAVSRFLGG